MKQDDYQHKFVHFDGVRSTPRQLGLLVTTAQKAIQAWWDIPEALRAPESMQDLNVGMQILVRNSIEAEVFLSGYYAGRRVVS